MSKDTAPRSRPANRGVSPVTEGDGREGTAAPSSPQKPSSPPGSTIPTNGSSAEARSTSPRLDGDLPVLGVAGLPVNPVAPTTGEYLLMSRSRRRTWIKLGIFLLLMALLANIAYLGPFTDPASGLPVHEPSPIPLSEVQPYGVNTFLQKEVESWKKDQTLLMAQELGVGWIKQQFPWAEIEYADYSTDPTNAFWDAKNNVNAWSKYDDIVSRAQQYGLRIIARIDSAPLWSHPNNSDPKAPPSAQYMSEFAYFVKTFVSRYQGTVAAIQVWNEPNLKAEWGGQPANAPDYVTLLKVAYQAAKEADPDMIVLAAPLATNNESIAYAGNLNELDYLQQMYDAGAKPYFDAMSANAYGTQYPPEDPPSTQKLNFRRVELLHNVMVKNGDDKKSVWFNEYGWNDSPSNVTPQPWSSVTEDQQADYTVRGIEYARANWPWAGVFTIWYLRQVGDIPTTDSEYYFGLVDPQFRATKTFRAVQKVATTEDQVATPGNWGPLSAAVQAPPSWQIRLDPSVPGGMYVSPSAVGNTLDVTFLGTQVAVNLVGSATPNQAQSIPARYYVTIDGSTSKVASELPRDANGAYINVPFETGVNTQVTLARDLSPEMRTSQHTLEIEVAPDPSGAAAQPALHTYSPVAQVPNLLGIGVVTVQAHRSYILFALLTVLLILTIVFAFLVLRRTPIVTETRNEK